ncbi:MAG TPA: hypothetical protein VGN03_00475 [Steroidobacteraceae bacterium]
MNRLWALLMLLLGVAAAAVNPPAALAATSSTPARWRSYNFLVEFHDLPRTYSCDDLWYKVRDVLLRLGARRSMAITPYACGFRGGGEARSPSVEVSFQIAEPLAGTEIRYADTTVGEQPVRFAPGSPSSLQPGDCEFMRQLQEKLLAGLPVHVTGSAFSCTSAANSFALTVEAPIAPRSAAPHG